ncbi:phosphoribosylglycinamide formyltransferase [bacterium]|nr:phosphoribosylglycinamide formyltransferase [bacterium]
MAFRLGVLGSGNGSNFQSIADAVAAGKLPGIEIAAVLSDVPNAFILERARKINVPAHYITPGAYKTKLEPGVEQQYVDILRRYSVDLVVLAGFMRLVKGILLSAFPERIINIHPSLLPAFPGLHSFKQAFDYGARITGCTVHFVDSGMDTGPIIGQRAVPILDGDTAQSVHQRIQVEEHILYPACIKVIQHKEYSLNGRRVIVKKTNSELNNLETYQKL